MPPLYHATQLPLFVLTHRCSKCKIEKPYDQFGKDKNRRNGLCIYCKSCRATSKEVLPDIPPGRKYCHKCKSILDLECFSLDRTRRDGRFPQCKVCCKNYRSQPYARERAREHVREQQKRISQSPEAQEAEKRRWKAYYHAHKEELNQGKAIAYAANPEKHREIARNKYQKNKHLWVNYTYKRRAMKSNGYITKVELRAIYERDTVCYICDKPIGSYPTQLDHVIPLFRNGEHTASNLRLTHTICNKRKKTRLLEEMTQFQRRGPDV